MNTPLPYGYAALEPYIDEKTMKLHHDRHLQTYIDNLNTLMEENPVLKQYTLEELLMNWCRMPQRIGIPVRNNAGGVYNHRFFFEGMGIRRKDFCDYEIIREIEKKFFSMQAFMELFKKTALGVFGSGYAWLVWEQKGLRIMTTANQNTPNLAVQCPLLNLDVWEHAYYLKHYNVRAAYIDDWFQTIDWRRVEIRYQSIRTAGEM